jgi:hypothetical protein
MRRSNLIGLIHIGSCHSFRHHPRRSARSAAPPCPAGSDRLHAADSAFVLRASRDTNDNSITIGGFHYNDPRMFQAELRYSFHF